MVDQSVDKAISVFSSARIEMQYNSLFSILQNKSIIANYYTADR